jgi:hypothetical protein
MSTPVWDIDPALLSERLLLTGGNAKFLLGYKYSNSTDGHRIGVNIIDGGASPNDTLVGISCGPLVANNKCVFGWRWNPSTLTDQRKFARWPQELIDRYGLANTPDPNFMTLHRSGPISQQSETVCLSKLGEPPLFLLSASSWALLGGRTIIYSWLDEITSANPVASTPYDNSIKCLVTCATQENGKIVKLGGPCPAPNSSKRWSLPIGRVIDHLVNGSVSFEVPLVSTVISIIRKVFPVVGFQSLEIVRTTEDLVLDLGPWPGTNPFVKARSDGATPTRLLQLPPCP